MFIYFNLKYHISAYTLRNGFIFYRPQNICNVDFGLFWNHNTEMWNIHNTVQGNQFSNDPPNYTVDACTRWYLKVTGNGLYGRKLLQFRLLPLELILLNFEMAETKQRRSFRENLFSARENGNRIQTTSREAFVRKKVYSWISFLVIFAWRPNLCKGTGDLSKRIKLQWKSMNLSWCSVMGNNKLLMNLVILMVCRRSPVYEYRARNSG